MADLTGPGIDNPAARNKGLRYEAA